MVVTSDHASGITEMTVPPPALGLEVFRMRSHDWRELSIPSGEATWWHLSTGGERSLRTN